MVNFLYKNIFQKLKEKKIASITTSELTSKIEILEHLSNLCQILHKFSNYDERSNFMYAIKMGLPLKIIESNEKIMEAFSFVNMAKKLGVKPSINPANLVIDYLDQKLGDMNDKQASDFLINISTEDLYMDAQNYNKSEYIFYEMLNNRRGNNFKKKNILLDKISERRPGIIKMRV